MKKQLREYIMSTRLFWKIWFWWGIRQAMKKRKIKEAKDAKKPQKKVLSESVTEVTGDKAKASASADKQTADIVYLQKLAGIS